MKAATGIAAAGVALAVGCAEPLAPGAWGTFRYFGELEGATPMRLLPPTTDRAGNVYVLHGDRERAENRVFVGHAMGGWSGGCQAHRGDFGVHGFVGRTLDTAWYWSGDALVQVDGDTGSCREVLRTDPVTGTGISFVAVAPWVYETPSRVRLLGMVQGAIDPFPYSVVVDLEQGRYNNPRLFEPDGAESVDVLGTGADPLTREGIFVVSYTSGAGRTTQAIYLDFAGNTTATVRLDLEGPREAYEIMGFVQVSDAGLAAALLAGGELLIFNPGQGGAKSVGDFTPSGILKWGGALYVTGYRESGPVIAKIDDNGSVGAAQEWGVSVSAGQALDQGIEVLDERTDPSRTTRWNDARTAIGGYPLLSPWPLDVYTTDSTGWLVAGPSFAGAVEDMTSVAFAPVGMAMP